MYTKQIQKVLNKITLPHHCREHLNEHTKQILVFKAMLCSSSSHNIKTHHRNDVYHIDSFIKVLIFLT